MMGFNKLFSFVFIFYLGFDSKKMTSVEYYYYLEILF
jgi:hypothetical protein